MKLKLHTVAPKSIWVHLINCIGISVCVFVCQGVVDSSTDVDLLWAEIKAARDVLTQIQNMRQGRLGDTAVTVESEVILHIVTQKYFCRQSK